MVSDTGSFVSPVHFMSAATRYQMLIDLDRTMLLRVFARLTSAQERLRANPVRFSINLSGPSIGNPDFLEWLSANIGADAVPGEWLQFEITETAAVANVQQTQTLIRRLRARGVQFALDDFGTGVSSFAYLKAFDVSMLKLDGSFTRDLLTDARSESLVRGIAQLCRSMGIETVAECVETEVVRAHLAKLGLDRAQGFLYGQPIPLESLFGEEVVPPLALADSSREPMLVSTGERPPLTAPRVSTSERPAQIATGAEPASVSHEEAVAHALANAPVHAATQVLPRRQLDAATQVLARAQPDAATQVLPRSPLEAATQVLPRSHLEAATQVLPRSHLEAATQVLPRTHLEAATQVLPRSPLEAATQVLPRTQLEAATQVLPRSPPEAGTEALASAPAAANAPAPAPAAATAPGAAPTAAAAPAPAEADSARIPTLAASS